MGALIANRFFWADGGRSEEFTFSRSTHVLDLATGTRVRLRIDAAGRRAEQHRWVEACAREHDEGTLLDFDYIGSAHRFEARGLHCGPRIGGKVPATAVIDWLDHARPSVSRILYGDEPAGPAAVGQRGARR